MYVAMEANDTVRPELVFSNPSSFDITVQVIATNITAIGVNDTVCDTLSPDNDYTMGLYNVTFPANVTTRLLDIPVCDDEVFEPEESFSISVVSNSLPDNVMDGNLNQATIVIVDDDCKFLNSTDIIKLMPYVSSAITISFVQTLYQVDESNGTVEITASLSNPSTSDITVLIFSNDITAMSKCMHTTPSKLHVYMMQGTNKHMHVSALQLG